MHYRFYAIATALLGLKTGAAPTTENTTTTSDLVRLLSTATNLTVAAESRVMNGTSTLAPNYNINGSFIGDEIVHKHKKGANCAGSYFCMDGPPLDKSVSMFLRDVQSDRFSVDRLYVEGEHISCYSEKVADRNSPMGAICLFFEGLENDKFMNPAACEVVYEKRDTTDTSAPDDTGDAGHSEDPEESQDPEDTGGSDDAADTQDAQLQKRRKRKKTPEEIARDKLKKCEKEERHRLGRQMSGAVVRELTIRLDATGCKACGSVPVRNLGGLYTGFHGRLKADYVSREHCPKSKKDGLCGVTS